MMRTAKLLRLLAHPARVAVLDELAGSEVPLSAKMLHERRGDGMPLEGFCYHVRVLRDAGLLVVVDRRRRRSAVETFYGLAPQARRFVEAAGLLADATGEAARIVDRRVG